jgi:hypothetical protein
MEVATVEVEMQQMLRQEAIRLRAEVEGLQAKRVQVDRIPSSMLTTDAIRTLRMQLQHLRG